MTAPIDLSPSASVRPGTAAVIRRTGLVAATSGAITAAGFASDYALAAHFITGPARFETAPGVAIYIAAVAALFALYWAAAAELHRDPSRRRFAAGLVAVSTAAVLLFGGFAVLGAQFYWTASLASPGEVVTFGLKSFASYAGPAVGSLVASILLVRSGVRARPVLLPALVGVAVTGALVVAVVASSAL